MKFQTNSLVRWIWFIMYIESYFYIYSFILFTGSILLNTNNIFVLLHYMWHFISRCNSRDKPWGSLPSLGRNWYLQLNFTQRKLIIILIFNDANERWIVVQMSETAWFFTLYVDMEGSLGYLFLYSREKNSLVETCYDFLPGEGDCKCFVVTKRKPHV